MTLESVRRFVNVRGVIREQHLHEFNNELCNTSNIKLYSFSEPTDDDKDIQERMKQLHTYCRNSSNTRLERSSGWSRAIRVV